MFRRHGAAVLVPHKTDHGIALADVIVQLFDQRGTTLSEMVLIADFQPLPPQYAGDFPAVFAQFEADGRNEDTAGGCLRHLEAPWRQRRRCMSVQPTAGWGDCPPEIIRGRGHAAGARGAAE